MNEIVRNVLKEDSSPQEVAQKVKDSLKKIKVQPKDHDLWNKILGEIDKVSPTHIRFFEMFNDLPTEVYWQIAEKVESIELDAFSPYLSPEERFQRALRCGTELTRLDLSDFRSLDDKRLKTLQETCPNLRSLNLSNTLIQTSTLSILQSFSKLEKLDVSSTRIATLDMLSKSLKELNLRNCTNLTTEELQNLHSFSKLEKLDVSSTRIATLDMLLKSLNELNLRNCTNLTAEEFQKLDDSFSKLEKLNASYTYITTLDKFPKSLKELYLGNCTNLTAQTIQALTSLDKLQWICLPSKFENEQVVSTLRTLNKRVIC